MRCPRPERTPGIKRQRREIIGSMNPSLFALYFARLFVSPTGDVSASSIWAKESRCIVAVRKAAIGGHPKKTGTSTPRQPPVSAPSGAKC